MTKPDPGTVYLDGRFLPASKALIRPDDRGFLFADGVYEVIRSYGGRLFEMAAHIERLRRSLREIRIDAAAAAGIEEVAGELLSRCGLAARDATVYLQITRGPAPRAHQFPSPAPAPTVYAAAAPLVPPPADQAPGIETILVPDTRWSRCDIKSISLLANVLARQMAADRGAQEALFVKDGLITEGASSTFCAVVSGCVVTHPLTERILPGITRRVVLRLCRKLGIPVAERPLPASDLERISEAFVLSTSREVAPIRAIDGCQVGHGAPGPLAGRLQEAFSLLTRPNGPDG